MMRAECCTDLEAQLHDMLEGWLSDVERAAVEAHLKACPECQRKVVGWIRVSDGLRTLPTLPAPKREKLVYATPSQAFSLPTVAAIWAILCVPSAWLLQHWSARGYLRQVEQYLPYSTMEALSQQLMRWTLSVLQQIQGVFG